MMNFRKVFSLGVLMVGIFAGVFAQGKIKFDHERHSFGTVNEAEGSVEHTFKFVNNGDKDLNLVQVKASCGCTTPTWTEEAIPPGGEGFVHAKFDPTNRPGKFEKFITVKTDGTPNVVFLRIAGTVSPRIKGPRDWYPFKDGNLRMKTNHIAFGEVSYGAVDTGSTILYNESDTAITLFLDKTDVPAHITMTADTNVIPPRSKTFLRFSIDTKQKADFGFLFEFIMLHTDDAAKSLKRINLSVDVKQDFSGMTAQERANAPRIVFDKTEHNFGDLTMGDRVTTTFKITNAGKSPLKILKTKASCGCTATKPGKNELAPGESTEVEVTFNSSGKKGHVTKYITVICNDPKKPEQRLKIISDVAPKPLPGN